MKICISATGDNLDSSVDPRFGRAAYFLVGDSKEEDFEAIKNEATAMMRGAGISAAQKVVNKKVETVITGNIGPNAYNVLNSAGVKIYTVDVSKTAKQVLGEFNQGKLKEAKKATGPGFGPGIGRGMGRGNRW